MKQFVSPTGRRIIGTADLVNVTALVREWTENGTPLYAGGSEVDWDSQLTRTIEGGDGKETMMVVDEDGEFHPLSDCTLVDE